MQHGECGFQLLEARQTSKFQIFNVCTKLTGAPSDFLSIYAATKRKRLAISDQISIAHGLICRSCKYPLDAAEHWTERGRDAKHRAGMPGMACPVSKRSRSGAQERGRAQHGRSQDGEISQRHRDVPSAKPRARGEAEESEALLRSAERWAACSPAGSTHRAARRVGIRGRPFFSPILFGRAKKIGSSCGGETPLSIHAAKPHKK